MLLHTLRQFFDSESHKGNKNLVTYNQYIDSIKNNEILAQITHQYIEPINTPAIRLISHVLRQIDIDYLNNCKNDIVRYNRYWMYIYESFKTIVERSSNKAYRGLFMKNNDTSTNEYLIAISRDDYLTYLPFNESFDKWEYLQPIKILSHDSDEYTIDIKTNQFVFHDKQPTYAVIGIDLITLCAMFYSYIQEHENNPMKFIHRYIMPKLTSGMINIWILHQLIGLIDITDESNIKSYHAQQDMRYDYVGLRYKSAMVDLWKMIQSVKTGRHPIVVFDSISMYDKKFSKHTDHMLQSNMIDFHKQRYWQLYIRDLLYIEFILKLYSVSTHPDKEKVFKKTKYQFQRFNRSKMLDYVKDDKTAMMLANHTSMIEQIIQ